MAYGTLDTADVLLNRGLNGGYGGLGVIANGNFAGDGSAVKEGVRGNRDISLLESVNRSGMDRSFSAQIDRQGEFLTDRINVAQQNDRFSSLERLIYANQNDTQRDLAAISNRQVECCCETKAGLAAIDAKIDNLAVLQAKDLEITKLQLQLAAATNSPGNSGN